MGPILDPERASRPAPTLRKARSSRLPKDDVDDLATSVQPIWDSGTFELKNPGSSRTDTT